MKATTQEVLDHWLKQFVEAVKAVRAAVGSDAMRKARNRRAEVETELVKAYEKHHRER